MEQISDDIVARDVSQQADSLDADVGGDAADLLGQTRAGRGEVSRRGTRDHARPQYWKVGPSKKSRRRAENENRLKLRLNPRALHLRSPESRHDGVIYMGLDGERDLLETFHTSHQVIQSVIDMVNNRVQKWMRFEMAA